jgi:hypothetical protein
MRRFFADFHFRSSKAAMGGEVEIGDRFRVLMTLKRLARKVRGMYSAAKTH